jgi:hypothetical protein
VRGFKGHALIDEGMRISIKIRNNWAEKSRHTAWGICADELERIVHRNLSYIFVVYIL